MASAITNYTIPKINRELQHPQTDTERMFYYTIPKINRELQHFYEYVVDTYDYTIPKINRELQHLDVHTAPESELYHTKNK